MTIRWSSTIRSVVGVFATAADVDGAGPTVTDLLASDTGDSGMDRVTAVPALTGTAEAGRVDTVLNGAATLGIATAGTDGTWICASTLADGSCALTAAGTDWRQHRFGHARLHARPDSADLGHHERRRHG